MKHLSYFFLFALVISILYSPIFFAGFAGDDVYQLVQKPLLHDMRNSVSLFGNVITSSESESRFVGFFYRPLTFATYTILYDLSNGNPFVFHLFQLMLFTVAVYLLFLFYKCFFPKWTAFGLASIFLVHPVNNELAAYIATLGDTFSLVFGLSALLVIGKSRTHTFPRLGIVFWLLLLALFSKETGIIFWVLAFAYALYKNCFIPYTMPLFLAGIVYLLFRVNASYYPLFTILPHPLVYESIYEHIYLSIQIAYAMIREIIVPTRASMDPTAFNPTLLRTIFPASMLVVVSVLLRIIYRLVKKYKKSYVGAFLFFFLWVVLGLLFFVHIIPLEVLFAARWLYILQIGLLGILGVVSMTIKLPDTKWIKLIYSLGSILVVCYAIETFILNIMWLSWEKYFHL